MNADRYLNQDIFNPSFLFHGTSLELEVLEPRQSVDSENVENVDNAIFLTSNFLTAVAYSISKELKKHNEHWSFSMNNTGEIPIMEFEVENIPDDLFGYVYIFDKDDTMIKDNHDNTTQYRCYHPLKPKEKIIVYYDDYKDYFSRKQHHIK